MKREKFYGIDFLLLLIIESIPVIFYHSFYEILGGLIVINMIVPILYLALAHDRYGNQRIAILLSYICIIETLSILAYYSPYHKNILIILNIINIIIIVVVSMILSKTLFKAIRFQFHANDHDNYSILARNYKWIITINLIMHFGLLILLLVVENGFGFDTFIPLSMSTYVIFLFIIYCSLKIHIKNERILFIVSTNEIAIPKGLDKYFLPFSASLFILGSIGEIYRGHWVLWISSYLILFIIMMIYRFIFLSCKQSIPVYSKEDANKLIGEVESIADIIAVVKAWIVYGISIMLFLFAVVFISLYLQHK